MAIHQVFNLAKKHADRAQEVGEKSMSLGDHLEELRFRLIRAIYGVILAACVAFYFTGDLIALILDHHGYAATIITTGPSGGFGEYMTVGLIASILLAAPWILWQLWQFIATGLYPRERKVVHIIIPFSTVMTMLGVGFAYFIMLPICLNFFISFNATSFPKPHPGQLNPVTRAIFDANDWMDKHTSAMPWDDAPPPTPTVPAAEITYDQAPIKLPILKEDPKETARGDTWINGADGSIKVTLAPGHTVTLAAANEKLVTPMPNLDDYIGFAAFMTLAVAVAFQIPVVMMVIGWTRLMPPTFFSGKRKFAALACVVLAALLTPSTDMFSLLVLAVPMYALFEGGLLVMRIAYNKKQRDAEDNLEGDDDLD